MAQKKTEFELLELELAKIEGEIQGEKDTATQLNQEIDDIKQKTGDQDVELKLKLTDVSNKKNAEFTSHSQTKIEVQTHIITI